jgi:hypothetical protein
MALTLIVTCVFASLLFMRGYFTQQNNTLLIVQILYRHGDRSPTRTFPTNPLPESSWPQGFGQLTQVGMHQHFELGKYFRKRYIEGEPHRLLNSSYNRLEIKIRSTDLDRTLMSAYSNLAGLYPPSGDQIWNKDLLWQPIPVHTVPVDTDYLLRVGSSCPQYKEYYQTAIHSDEIKKQDEENKEFYQLLANKTGNEIENLIQAGDVLDPIFCARSHGLLEPSWVNLTWNGKTIFDTLREIHNLQFDLMYNRPGESRLTGGPLLKEMIENMQSLMSKKSEFKSHIYSAHDTTMTAFLSALKVFSGITPPYGSAAMLELHKINGKHVIRLLYKNDSTHDAYSLQIPGCNDSCLFEDFIRLTKDNIPIDWLSECRIKSTPTFDTILLLIMVIIFMSFLLVTILVYAVQRKRTRHKGNVAYGELIAKDIDTF